MSKREKQEAGKLVLKKMFVRKYSRIFDGLPNMKDEDKKLVSQAVVFYRMKNYGKAVEILKGLKEGA